MSSGGGDRNQRARRVLVVRHERRITAGYVGERARQLGFELVEVETELPRVKDFDLVILLGSVESVYDEQVPWIVPELRMVEQALARRIPVLGICFGAQLLSRALGGSVHRGQLPEFGWVEVDTDDPTLIPRGPWLEAHRDVFTVPSHAVELARTEAGPQAFVADACLGIQFHPETTVETLERWGEVWRESHRDILSPEQVEAILQEARQRRDHSRMAAHNLLDAFLERSSSFARRA